MAVERKRSGERTRQRASKAVRSGADIRAVVRAVAEGAARWRTSSAL